jgi:multicomponent Na+:H+ antiporter subunit B
MISLPASFDANLAINIALLAMLLVLVVVIARMRSLLAIILLLGLYSLIVAAWFVVMDAPDVAFTEAVVGAGVSTLILLGAILLTRGETERSTWRSSVFPALVALAAGTLLVYAAIDLPSFGNPASPANGYVGRLYLQSAVETTGAPNVVTAVLASYRGFDTLGETVVIFAGGIGVALMLGFGERTLSETSAPLAGTEGKHHVVLRVAAKLLIPIIALYAFYVQFHGDLGPGGGFQAGVILAVAVILHALVFGLHETMIAIRPGLVRRIASLGVLVYAGVGVVSIANGGDFLDYDRLFSRAIEAQIPDWLLGPAEHPGDYHWGQHFGILLVELGVLLTVFATMVTIFYGFAGRSSGATTRQGAR